uniref:Uncharacterized protein n=1 Tax=Lotharella oceanica TaxID=641309 RepID=A0A7S2X778_9EUKA
MTSYKSGCQNNGVNSSSKDHSSNRANQSPTSNVPRSPRSAFSAASLLKPPENDVYDRRKIIHEFNLILVAVFILFTIGIVIYVMFVIEELNQNRNASQRYDGTSREYSVNEDVVNIASLVGFGVFQYYYSPPKVTTIVRSCYCGCCSCSCCAGNQQRPNNNPL